MNAPRRTGLRLRLPEDLHEALAKLAAEQGVSLNLLVVSLLAGALGWPSKAQAGSSLARRAKRGAS